MDLLNDNIKKVFFRYLLASFGSALIVSLYSIVDTAIVGQYEGANGVAAIAVFAPIWSIIISFGLLFGIGGSVIYSSYMGSNNTAKAREVFTISLIGVLIVSLLLWFALLFYGQEILIFFGADDEILPLALKYLSCIKYVIPTFIIGQFLTCFLRNDNAPLLATFAILGAAIFNMIGDYVFVFVFDMGIFGASLATALGQIISISIMFFHFFNKKNNLKLSFSNISNYFKLNKDIIFVGFSTFFIDITVGFISIFINRQIMYYIGNTALGVYGVIININILVLSCSYAIGQAAQPIISKNIGANKYDRIHNVFKLSIVSSIFISCFWFFITMSFPDAILSIFIDPTSEILDISSGIMRCYFISFIFMPLNIFSAYYFQAILKSRVSFVISILRGLVFSGLFIFCLPLINSNLIWFAMPLTEIVVACLSVFLIFKYKIKNKE